MKITHSAVTGTNANSTSATTVTLSYNHPGGFLYVVGTQGGAIGSALADATCSFNGIDIPQQTSIRGTASPYITSWLFFGYAPAANHTITVTFPYNLSSRGCVAVSLQGVGGIRGTDVFYATCNAAATYYATINSDLGDYILTFQRWRNSAVNPTGDDILISDDSPNRFLVQAYVGATPSTTSALTYTSSASNHRIVTQCALRPGFGDEQMRLTQNTLLRR